MGRANGASRLPLRQRLKTSTSGRDSRAHPCPTLIQGQALLRWPTKGRGQPSVTSLRVLGQRASAPPQVSSPNAPSCSGQGLAPKIFYPGAGPSCVLRQDSTLAQTWPRADDPPLPAGLAGVHEFSSAFGRSLDSKPSWGENLAVPNTWTLRIKGFEEAPTTSLELCWKVRGLDTVVFTFHYISPHFGSAKKPLEPLLAPSHL